MIVDEIYRNNNSRMLNLENLRSRNVIKLSDSLKSSKIKPGIIAEYKRKSPSGFNNLINNDRFKYFNSIKENIAGISILTEPHYFNGDQLDAASVQCYSKPILIKDFISNRKMVKSSFMIGGDIFLLIADFLDGNKIKDLVTYGKSLGMEALIEVHKPENIKNIIPDENVIVGYNRRNLETLKMEDNSEYVYDKLKSFGLPLILESGINSENAKNLHLKKYDGLLIGSSLLSSDSINKIIEALK